MSAWKISASTTKDPEVVIVEFTQYRVAIKSQEAFSCSYIMVMTIRDGLIVHSRDYANPISGAKALGRLPLLIADLQEMKG